jgi:hypothetical protein
MVTAGQLVNVVGQDFRLLVRLLDGIHLSSSQKLAFVCRDTAEKERQNDWAGEVRATGVRLPR